MTDETIVEIFSRPYLAWGIGVMIVIYLAGGISDAHLISESHTLYHSVHFPRVSLGPLLEVRHCPDVGMHCRF